MVAPVENRTMITGVVTGRKPHPAQDGSEMITVEVRASAPVSGFADLLTRRAADQGGSLELVATAPEVRIGDRIEAQATLAGPGVIRAVGPVRSSPAA